VPFAKFRAIIFDIGRVLIQVDIHRAMAGLPRTLNSLLKRCGPPIENDPRWLDWQEGRISPQDWHLHLSKRLGGSLTFEQFKDVWNSALAPEPIQPEGFLETLSKNYRLALLSNTDPIHMSHEEARFPFFRFFPTRIYSTASGPVNPIRSSTAKPCAPVKSALRKPSTLMTSRPTPRPLNGLA